MALTRERHFIILGTLAGLVSGATLGAWTLASQRPGRIGIHTSTAEPPPAPSCPENYRRAQGLDVSATAEGTHARYLVRCEPVTAGSPISEALELFWTPEMYLDGRLRGDRTVDFVRALMPSDSMTFERALRTDAATVRSTSAAHLEADGTLRIRPLAVRVWALPVGANTLQVTLVTPRDRATAAATIVRGSLDGIQGLRPFDANAQGQRGWHVQVQCPAGYTDATPPDGGPARTNYLGRYCLAPDAAGGFELSYTESTVRADGDEPFRQLLALSVASMTQLGVVSGAGWGPTETLRVGGHEVRSATLEAAPAPAHVRVFAYQLTAEQGSLFAFASALRDNSDGTRDALRAWIDGIDLIRPYEPSIVNERRRSRFIGGVVLPAGFTGVIGALIGRWFGRRRRRDPGETASD